MIWGHLPLEKCLCVEQLIMLYKLYVGGEGNFGQPRIGQYANQLLNITDSVSVCLFFCLTSIIYLEELFLTLWYEVLIILSPYGESMTQIRPNIFSFPKNYGNGGTKGKKTVGTESLKSQPLRNSPFISAAEVPQISLAVKTRDYNLLLFCELHNILPTKLFI